MFLVIPWTGLQLTPAHCCRPSASLWQHSSPVLMSFLNQMIQITSSPQHLDGGKEPSRLRWDNQEIRRMRMGGEALFIWLLRLWSEWEGTSAFPEGWRPVLTDLLNASPWNWGLGNPNHAIWGKGAGACKARRTLQSLKCIALNQHNDSSVQCLLIVPSDSAPNSGN